MKQQPALQTLAEIAQNLGIANWDLLLVGDGSGSGWAQGCGWATTLVDNQTRERWQFVGGMNMGSINLAELMPYLHALTWYHANVGKQRIASIGRPLVVHIITDSQVIAAQGQQAAELSQSLPKVQEAQWAAMRQLAHMGYLLHYHWIERCTTALNWAADLLAGMSRRAVRDCSRGPLNPEWLTWARTVHDYWAAREPGNPLLPVIRPLLEQFSTPAQQCAQAIEQVGMRDPASGEPIDVTQLDP